MKVAKVFNNSVVLGVDEQGREVVLFGRGVGFQARAGDVVDLERVERRFTPSAAGIDRIAAFVEQIPAEEVDLTVRIVADAREQLGKHVTDAVLIPLADHLVFALRRAAEGTAEVDYPLRWEVARLYPAELEFARGALRTIEAERGVRLPPGEAVPIALHLVNAQFGASPDMQTTVEMTQVLTRTLALVHERFGLELDEDSPAVARFVLHLRYLIVRQRRGQTMTDKVAGMFDAVRDGAPEEYEVARDVAELLAERFGWDVGDEERVYLTLHIARLRAAGAEQTQAGQA